MPARSRTQQAANPSPPADSIEALRSRTRELEAEWRELPHRRSEALLGADEQAVVRLMIRERRLPLEWLDTLRQRVASCRASLEAELNALTKERSELRQRLKPLYDELLASFKRFNELQVRYACLCPDERELEFLLLGKRPYSFVQPEELPIQRIRDLLGKLDDCELQLNRLREGIVQGDSETLRRAHAMLDGEPCPLLQTLASLEEKLNAEGSSKG